MREPILLQRRIISGQPPGEKPLREIGLKWVQYGETEGLGRYATCDLYQIDR